MAIDTLKCVGCSDCVVACQTENKVPLGFCRDWVVETVRGKYPETRLEIRSERCNHCDNPPCVRCCPTGASYKGKGGIVLVEGKKCIGCGACIQSCPYDSRYVHPKGYVDKCTFCYDRLEKGFGTACTEVCPTQCIIFGDMDDPESRISKILAERDHKTLIPEAGTEPRHYFLI